jgi:hypothetical protein
MQALERRRSQRPLERCLGRRADAIPGMQWEWIAGVNDVEVGGGPGQRNVEQAVAADVGCDDVLGLDDYDGVEFEPLGLCGTDEVDRLTELSVMAVAPRDPVRVQSLLLLCPAGVRADDADEPPLPGMDTGDLDNLCGPVLGVDAVEMRLRRSVPHHRLRNWSVKDVFFLVC